MSGHSKWSTIKRQKGATDKARGQLFTKLSNAITIAVREGGGTADPESNFRLRLAMEKARTANMPKENIQRALDRASGKLAGANTFEEVMYEGFGPGGVALLAEGVTDNKQRTSAAVKNVFSTRGGTLGGVGSVAYLFEKVGLLSFAQGDRSADTVLELVLEAGAEDFEQEDTNFIVYTKPQDLYRVKDFLEKKGIMLSDTEITFKPRTVIEITDQSVNNQVLNLIEALDELDDIQRVHVNLKFASA